MVRRSRVWAHFCGHVTFDSFLRLSTTIESDWGFPRLPCQSSDCACSCLGSLSRVTDLTKCLCVAQNKTVLVCTGLYRLRIRTVPYARSRVFLNNGMVRSTDRNHPVDSLKTQFTNITGASLSMDRNRPVCLQTVCPDSLWGVQDCTRLRTWKLYCHHHQSVRVRNRPSQPCPMM